MKLYAAPLTLPAALDEVMVDPAVLNPTNPPAKFMPP